ncbi:hypothetical protein BOTBODRAFT_407897 [Botryobasidium botryosum FD-172 SS1]|uniref:Uncharacterized protein n=1 Tax=Botryobasidium botryosum (strain FD-172 SS1) TaxID=930990 RepID=A0A067MAB0_BOTB1|nr:hypothetical protein BOTBODRAFT_407897 [Botryobasidium botryosum FD-172 SS1]
MTSDPVSRPEAALIGAWMGAMFYGIYIPLFFTFLWISFARKHVRRPNWILIISAILLFLMGTAYVAVGLRRMIEGFIISKNSSHFFNDLTLWAATASDSIYGAINLVGDSIVIYRCYVVWESNIPIIILPVIMLIASIATGCYAVAGLHYIPRGSEAITFTARISNYARANFILSLALNVLCTALVAYRIWASARRVSALGARHTDVYYGALAVVVESAGLYTVSLAIYIGLYLGELHAETILFDINAQIMVRMKS